MTRRTKATPRYRLEVGGWLEEQQTFDFGCVLISLGAVTGLWQLLRGRMVILPFSNPTQVLVSSPHWFPLQPSDYFYNLHISDLFEVFCKLCQELFAILYLWIPTSLFPDCDINIWVRPPTHSDVSTFPLRWPLVAEKRSKIIKSVRTDDQIW